MDETGLKKEWIGYKDISEVTGIKISTLRRYNTEYGRKGKPRLIPPPDIPGHWKSDRQDIQDWITKKSRPGRGARTDIKMRTTADKEEK